MAFVCFAACGGALVPIEPMPIEWVSSGRHGAYEKGGITIDGWNCGEAYQRAVTGVPEAEALMRECSSYIKAYGALMTGFVVLPIGSIAGGAPIDDHGTRDAVIGVGVGLALTSFALGLVMGHVATTKRAEAVHIYNARYARLVPPPPPMPTNCRADCTLDDRAQCGSFEQDECPGRPDATCSNWHACDATCCE